MKKVIGLIALSIILSCGNQKNLSESNSNDDMKALTKWMTGTFSSSTQSAADSAFYDITLNMVQIWSKNKEANWLYVEQAVSSNLKKPYRQRVYKLGMTHSGKIASEVFELPNDNRFIHGWENKGIFNKITPDSLITREGCTVFLNKISQSEYAGSTMEDACKSSLYGASFATSKVQVFEDRIVSWDQGWDDDNNQVWGAEKGGYIFNRLE